MSHYRLVIGNKNYSSWSLRPWLAMKQTGIPFEERRVLLYAADSKQRLAQVSPSGKVPVLIDGELVIWDSLAICEYLAERHPGLWPSDAAARAVARALSAEMHSGFGNLRTNMTMNIRKDYAGKGVNPGVSQDIARIFAAWTDCRDRFGAGGPFLFGQFSIADAMYAPVVMRLRTYAVALPPNLAPYYETMLALPAMRDWIAASEADTESIPSEDMYG
jgi:glutathione S-transferase